MKQNVIQQALALVQLLKAKIRANQLRQNLNQQLYSSEENYYLPLDQQAEILRQNTIDQTPYTPLAIKVINMNLDETHEMCDIEILDYD